MKINRTETQKKELINKLLNHYLSFLDVPKEKKEAVTRATFKAYERMKEYYKEHGGLYASLTIMNEELERENLKVSPTDLITFSIRVDLQSIVVDEPTPFDKIDYDF